MTWQINHGDFASPNRKDEVHLITGATRGIGRAIALSLAHSGATVILQGRDESALETLYDEIVEKGLPEPVIFPIDLMELDQAGARELAGMIEETFGKLDGLINNAGVLGNRGPVATIPPKEFNEVMKVNVEGSLWLSQALLPLLDASPQGTLIFTSSGVGVHGRAYWGSYAISKFAIEGLAQLLSEELENTSSTRVFCVDPGATRTNMRASAYPGEDTQNNPPASELAPFYQWLLSSESESLKGTRVKARLDR